MVVRLNAGVRLDRIEVSFSHERSHRILVVLRGAGLDPRMSDTDPQHDGLPSLEPRAHDPAATRTATSPRR